MAVIEVRNLQKRYGDTVAVRDVSFAVEAGEIFGILGPNGAGKTTTVEIIAGLRTRDGGSVEVLGRPPRDMADRGADAATDVRRAAEEVAQGNAGRSQASDRQGR